MLISKGFKKRRQHFREPLVYMYIIGYADIQFLRFMVYFMSRASPERKQIHSIFKLGATITFARRAMCLDTILTRSDLEIDKFNILNDG